MVQVGDKLWCVFSERYLGTPRYGTITKVGREYLTLDFGNPIYRVRKDNFRLLGFGGSCGQCYRTKEEWSAKEALEHGWRELRIAIDRSRQIPDGVTVDDINNARKSLKI